ncbi:MAG TPA: cytochrome P450 [Solirubrobacteraceae bacterium]|jgi:cytochrome P450|nr:cytochrome P450 [Solirubrobacteraceae bacterium]
MNPQTPLDDLSGLDFWAQTPAERSAAFARMRAEQPISWQRQPDTAMMPQEDGTGGYWAVLRYEDVRTVSRDPDTFRSGAGVIFEDIPPEILEASQSFLAMDDPRHAKLRKLVSVAFTPRQVKLIEDGIRADAAEIVNRLDADGDFVQQVSKQLPLMTIMRMLGVPEAERERLVDAADAMVSVNDPVFMSGREPLAVIGESLFILHTAAKELLEQRRHTPTGDLLSGLAHAEVDGERLTDDEIAAFFVLLSVAGNDTTRQTTSHALRALCDFPDQRAALLADLDGGLEAAVEEFIRWATPVMTFRRTATRDTELSGQPIAAGEKVVMFYSSANRDEDVFAGADRLDLARDPNRHVGFGGGGPHFCMGAPIARSQLRAIFHALLSSRPSVAAGQPRYLVGNFINAIGEMPAHYGPLHNPARAGG